MSAKSYRFDIGQIECAVLLDGATVSGKDRILKRFHDATEAEYRKAYADIGLSLDGADSSFNVLLMKTGDATVLVDAGEGGQPTGGHLAESLSQVGLTPEEITLVVITHTHGDHVLGLLADNGEPRFPNATYVISKEELVFWKRRIESGSAEHQPIVSMMESHGLRQIEMDEPIVDGVTAVPLPGHTPGQIGLRVESDGETLFHMADLIHSPMQFAHPEWSPSFDHDTGLSVPTRRDALGRAASEQALALFYHLTFPGLGRVKRAGEGFSWEPLPA